MKMNDNDKDWLKDLADKMADYEEEAPQGLWDGIESDIFKEKSGRAAVPAFIWRAVAVAAAVALGVFAAVKLMPGPSDPEKFDVVAQVPETAPDAADSPSEVNEYAPEAAVPSSGGLLAYASGQQGKTDNKGIFRKSQTGAEAAEAGTDAADAVEEDEAATETEERPASVTTAEKVQSAEESPLSKTAVTEAQSTDNEIVTASKDKIDEYAGEGWPDDFSEDTKARRSGKHRPSISASYSGTSAEASETNSFSTKRFYRGIAPSAASFDKSHETETPQTRGTAPLYITDPSTGTTSVNHKRPVRFALTVNVPLGKTFGIESGLTFTRLESDYTTSLGTSSTEVKQTLDYVGVPLDITATLVRAKWFSLYLSGGGMVEKCVSAKTTTTEILSGAEKGGKTIDRFSVKPLLWSVDASAGLQVNATRNIGLYAEPGVSYHFDDGSQVQTIYKKNPFDFILTFGARYSF